MRFKVGDTIVVLDGNYPTDYGEAVGQSFVIKEIRDGDEFPIVVDSWEEIGSNMIFKESEVEFDSIFELQKSCTIL